MKRSYQSKSARSERRNLSEVPSDWTVRLPDCVPRMTTAGIEVPEEPDVYVIGVDGDRLMPPINPFTLNPYCQGLDYSQIRYEAMRSDGYDLPSGVDFYPNTR